MQFTTRNGNFSISLGNTQKIVLVMTRPLGRQAFGRGLLNILSELKEMRLPGVIEKLPEMKVISSY